MSQPRSIIRLLIASLMLIPLLGVTLSTMSVRAQDAGASVVIHKRTCPTGYAGNNYFEDCHDNPAEGVTFELANLRDTTGPEGNVRFFNLNPGTYTITESVPGEFADTVVYCSMGENNQQTASFDYVAGGISLTVPENAEIVCDWYNIPLNLRGTPGDGNGDGGNGVDAPGEGAAVTIHARLCPPGYTGNEPFEVCHDMPLTGATFTLDGLTATTGQDGNTLFYQLNPGTYTIERAGQGTFWYDSVFCSMEQDVSQDVPVEDTDGGFTIDLDANQQVICDWYFIPQEGAGQPDGEDGPGELTIHKLLCPEGYEGSNYFEDCHDNRLPGVEFDVFGPEGLFEEGVATDDEGVLTIDNIEVGGTVNVFEQFTSVDPTISTYVVYCSNAAGNQVPFDYQPRPEDQDVSGIRIDVFRGDEILCDWYNIPAA